MRIIPAIDIIDGKCVRLTKGDYATKKIYNEHPLEVAKEFEGMATPYLEGTRRGWICCRGLLFRRREWPSRVRAWIAPSSDHYEIQTIVFHENHFCMMRFN